MADSRFSLVWVTLVTILASSSGSSCHQLYTVGFGQTLWGIPPYLNYYQDWANGISLFVNDTLYFQYSYGLHNVVFAKSEDDISTCSLSSSPIYDDESGAASVRFTEEHTFYVMSWPNEDPSDCISGMRFKFHVSSLEAISPPASAPSGSQASPTQILKLSPQQSISPSPIIGVPPSAADANSPLGTSFYNVTTWKRNITTIDWKPKAILPQTLPVNSYILFYFSRVDNYTVIRVNKTDFDNCDSGSPLETFTFGTTVILPQPGFYYYIDANSSLCKTQNMKLEVLVPNSMAPAKAPSISLPLLLSTTIASTLAIFIVGLIFYAYRQHKSLCYSQSFGFNGKYYKSDADKAKMAQTRKRLTTMMTEQSGTNLCTVFTFKELQIATSQFSQDNQLGSGAFGTVYKGILADRRAVAIKCAKNHGATDAESFVNEVSILSQVNHRNLVKLLGCCVELDVPLLVYEFIPNGTLHDHLLLAQEGYSTKLDWPRRFNIALQTADALKYLHCHATPPIYHRDVKTANILLDEDFGAKVGDFGLSKLVDLEATHVSTCVRGTPGYLDPEYYYNSHLTDKSDVYSFGVVLLELITSKNPIDLTLPASSQNLVVRSMPFIRNGRTREIVDAQLVKEFSASDIITVEGVAQIAAACLVPERASRPSMTEVVEMLQKLRGSDLRAEAFYSGANSVDVEENALPWKSVSSIFRSQWSQDYRPEPGQLNSCTTTVRLAAAAEHNSSHSRHSNTSSETFFVNLVEADKGSVQPR